MKISIVLILSLVAVSCHVNKDKFRPMADNIKKELMTEIPDVKTIDTIYLLIRTISPRDKIILQAIEYLWASTEAKNNGDSDSLILKEKSNQIFRQSDFADSTTFLFYEAAPMAIYTKRNSQKGMADTKMFFDKDFNFIPKYTVIQKIAKTDNDKLRIEPYKPFTAEEYASFDSMRILKYY
jgi:hypothetical protein